MSRHHDIGSRYEEPDTTDDGTAKCCKCGEHFDVEMMETKDCIKFICPECKRDADEAAGDAKRAEQKDEGVWPTYDECERFDHHDDDRSSI